MIQSAAHKRLRGSTFELRYLCVCVCGCVSTMHNVSSLLKVDLFHKCFKVTLRLTLPANNDAAANTTVDEFMCRH